MYYLYWGFIIVFMCDIYYVVMCFSLLSVVVGVGAELFWWLGLVLVFYLSYYFNTLADSIYLFVAVVLLMLAC